MSIPSASDSADRNTGHELDGTSQAAPVAGAGSASDGSRILSDLAGTLTGAVRSSAKTATESPALQDRLFGLLMQRLLPTDASAESQDNHGVWSNKDYKSPDRPKFSLAIMSSNFRRFNARIGIIFVLQNQVIDLLTWRKASHTLSLLAIFSLLCLQPNLVPAIPFGLVFFYIMIPSFMARHPPAPRAGGGSGGTNQSAATKDPSAPPSVETEAAAVAERYAFTNSYATRPVAPPQVVRPAPEMSSDFFRNMRDIQNIMEDFSSSHDTLVAAVAPLTDFSDEKTSSAVYVIICMLLSSSFVASHLIPWRFVVLLLGWAVILDGHPVVHHNVRNSDSFADFIGWSKKLTGRLSSIVDAEMLLDQPPEIRQVEIFELQRLVQPAHTSFRLPKTPTSPLAPVNPVHKKSSSVASSHQQQDEDDVQEYEPWLFSPTPYVPLSPVRLSNARPPGTRFLGDVQPPAGWVWRDKKWTLDLFADVIGPSSWVEERCITGVEVEQEGERWVNDLINIPSPAGEASKAGKKDGKSKDKKSWEEGTGRRVKGEWRRRRWVRTVERQHIDTD